MWLCHVQLRRHGCAARPSPVVLSAQVEEITRAVLRIDPEVAEAAKAFPRVEAQALPARCACDDVPA